MHSLLPVRQYLTSPSTGRLAQLTTVIATLLMVGGCASTDPIPSNVEVRDVLPSSAHTPLDDGQSSAYQDGPTLVASPIDQAETYRQTSRAEYYQQQAQAQSDEFSRIEANLSSAEYYVQANQHEQAAQIVNAIRPQISDQIQLNRATVILAYADYANGNCALTLSRLEPLLRTGGGGQQDIYQTFQTSDQDIEPSDDAGQTLGRDYITDDASLPSKEELSIQQVDALLLASFCHQALGHNQQAIHTLIRRESALHGSARAETTRYIWQVINNIPEQQRVELAENSAHKQVRNRVTQSLTGEIGLVKQKPQQFNQWREDNHPDENTTVVSSEWDQLSPRSIYVLLPLSSRYSKAAQAVKAGIERQHDANESSYGPNLSFYDIGDNPLQIGQYYAAAVRSGADFIIGPLGKDYSNEAANISAYYAQNTYSSSVPMLMLGGDLALSSGNMRFDMSPETEGQNVAERAWKDGHLSAGVISNNSRRAQRVLQGFTGRWLSLGGKMGKSVEYSEQQYDHSVELKQLFDIQRSEYRFRKLSQELGFKPKFVPYQRGDIDFVFMVADDKTGRILRPQINFFTNSQMSVYSTSALYNGIQDTMNNMDLDNTLFPVMPWVVKSGQSSQYAGQLNMLYAMGMDAYRVAGNVSRLKGASRSAISGATGQLELRNGREIIHSPVWAKFENGELQVVDSLGLDITPVLNDDINNTDGEQGSSPKKSKGSYNDQNWDSGQSRRKTGG